MVPADGAIFRGTLADNIRYKYPAATDKEVWQAAMAAGMQSTLDRLPQGLETPVGESGIGLSVGERQRIQIARMLVAHTRIMILDEATANLDFATEEEVKKTIENIRRSTTIIIIAHRYSMVRDADQVIVLAEGKILETGSPAELLEKGGWFTRFAESSKHGQDAASPPPFDPEEEDEYEEDPENPEDPEEPGDADDPEETEDPKE
jgi:ABC-type multidrug transport system fused ATPase/permease subunit